jgi:hypothetical protein
MVGLSLFPSRVEVSEHKTLLKLNWKERKEKRKKFLLLFPQEFPRKGKYSVFPSFLYLQSRRKTPMKTRGAGECKEDHQAGDGRGRGIFRPGEFLFLCFPVI